MEIQKARWLYNARKRPRWPVVWERCLVSGQGGHSFFPSFTGGYPSFTYTQDRVQAKEDSKERVAEAPKVCRLLPQPPTMPFFQRLRQRMKWWRRHALTRVLALIKYGVPCQWSPLHPPSLQLRPSHRSCADQTAALQVLKEYTEVGAVDKVSHRAPTQFLVPWFVIRKSDR